MLRKVCEVCNEAWQSVEAEMCDRCYRFKTLNDSIWGAGNWVACDCTLDDRKKKCYHHKNAHK